MSGNWVISFDTPKAAIRLLPFTHTPLALNIEQYFFSMLFWLALMNQWQGVSALLPINDIPMCLKRLQNLCAACFEIGTNRKLEISKFCQLQSMGIICLVAPVHPSLDYVTSVDLWSDIIAMEYPFNPLTKFWFLSLMQTVEISGRSYFTHPLDCACADMTALESG